MTNTISDRVRETRKKLKMTQIFLSERAGMSQGTLSDLERGKNKSSLELVSLARELHVNAEWLATGKVSREIGNDTKEPIPKLLVLIELDKVTESLNMTNQTLLLEIAKTLKSHQ
jgi:transcriptional regulator with XRE-family HTH domain